MSASAPAAPVASNEWLARFILQSSHLRQDRTVRPDAFIPHPYPDLSVTRRLELTETQLWEIGKAVAESIPKKLHGRADIRAEVFEKQKLRVLAAPDADNPNHANVTGWPGEKSAQKSLAQEISAEAGKALEVPPEFA